MRGVWWIGLLAAMGCSGGDNAKAVPALAQVPDSVAREVVSVLPEDARLARPVSRGDVGLGDSFVVVWSIKDVPGFSAGVVADGKLHHLPALHGERVPHRIGGVMAVQADADSAGELVVLLDFEEARPERRMTPQERPFEPVVVDHGAAGFVRVAELEAAVSGLSRPNEIREKLLPAPGDI